MTERRRHVKESDSRRRRRPPWTAMVAMAVVVVAIAMWTAFSVVGGGPRTSMNEDGSVTIVGEGDAITDTFEVSDGWRIDWSSAGPSFSFAITGDRDFGTVIDEEGEVSGITNPVGSGRYALEITAEGEWEITVFPGEG